MHLKNSYMSKSNISKSKINNLALSQKQKIKSEVCFSISLKLIEFEFYNTQSE